MKVPVQKAKCFAVGLGMAGMTALAAIASSGGQRLCSGSCSQCYACGLTALPPILWLVFKRWHPLSKIRNSFGKQPSCVKRLHANSRLIRLS